MFDHTEVGTLSTLSRDSLLKPQEVARIERNLQHVSVRLEKDDGASVLKHAKRLQDAGDHIFVKTADDLSPPGSGLRPNTFILIFQTRYQTQCWKHFGHNRIACVDGTHNTTQYLGATLFTLVVCDDWGRGMPAAFMLASDGTEATMTFYLRTVRGWNSLVIPRLFMSDRDQGQINSIHTVYACTVYLCRWHVLHAWHQHIKTDKYPELWNLLKKWVYAETEQKFDLIWSQIQALDREKCPESIIAYLTKNWVGEKTMWAAYFRCDRTIFERADTNMLVEAWHHLLKGYFNEGVRNRRMDHLIHTLSVDCMQYFKARHQRQLAGLEGHNLLETAKQSLEERAMLLLATDITPIPDREAIFNVQSQSDRLVYHTVDVRNGKCSCRAFPLLNYCRHLSAVHRHFPSIYSNIQPAPVSSSVDPILSEPPSLASTSDVSSRVSNEGASAPVISVIDQARNAHLIGNLRNFLDLAETNPEALAQVDISTLQHELATLTQAVATPPAPQILPALKEKIAPNQSTDWKSTAALMGSGKPMKVLGMDVKKGAKRTITDPYAGGERSGKKMKGDDAVDSTPGYVNSVPVELGINIPLRTSDVFDTSTFDIGNLPALNKLILSQIKPLCRKHNLSSTGKKAELIDRLYNHSKTLPTSFLPAGTSSTHSDPLPVVSFASSLPVQVQAPVNYYYPFTYTPHYTMYPTYY